MNFVSASIIYLLFLLLLSLLLLLLISCYRHYYYYYYYYYCYDDDNDDDDDDDDDDPVGSFLVSGLVKLAMNLFFLQIIAGSSQPGYHSKLSAIMDTTNYLFSPWRL